MYPFVTCLCLTRNRRQWLPRAIRCFLNQTYPKKELLILADGEDVRDLVENLDVGSGENSVRYIFQSGSQQIGDKRNTGSELASGEVILSWDDDDWSAPERIQDQVARMQYHQVSVTGYHSMLFTDGRVWWKYHGNQSANLGSSLCYRKNWWEQNKFPSRQIGEDSGFIHTAYRKGQYSSVDAGELMVASIHAGNSSPRALSGESWKRTEDPKIGGYF